MGFKCLVRDQEVDGSNPFAPTTSFKANNLQQRKVPTTSWLCAKRSVVQMSSPNDLISLCKLELSGVTLRLHFPHVVAHVAQTGYCETLRPREDYARRPCAWRAKPGGWRRPRR